LGFTEQLTRTRGSLRMKESTADEFVEPDGSSAAADPWHKVHTNNAVRKYALR